MEIEHGNAKREREGMERDEGIRSDRETMKERGDYGNAILM